MTAQQQDERVALAMREDFTFTPHNPGEWICETAAGNAYLVTEGGQCSCPDAEYRVKDQGRCKHAVALGARLIELGYLPEPAASTSAAEWLAGLDLTAVDQHLEEAKKQDEQEEDREQEAAARRWGALREELRAEREEVAKKLSRDLGRQVIWTEREEAAFDKIFG